MAIMKKRHAKFPLILENDNEANTMEELQEYFDLEKIIGYFHSGKLITWLEDRLYADEADEVRKLTGKEEDLGDRLCRIFHFENLEDDPETVAWRNERIERVKKYTSNPAIINNVDFIAFNQDDLEDIVINGDTNVIYLCDNEFIFPSGILRKKNMRYVGIGKGVKVVVKSKETIDLETLGIVFENVNVEGNYKKLEIVSPSSSYNDKEDEEEEDYDYWPDDEISLKVRELITECMFVDEVDFKIDDIVDNIGFGDDNQHIKYVINLALKLKDMYHIEIDDKTVSELSFGTVDNLISYIKKNTGYYDALKNVNILVVDDAAFMRMIVKDILTKYNGNVVGEAENGIKAIEKFQFHRPDIVIMDISMPEMDGITALKHIKKIDPYAKIIVSSAIGQQESVIEAIQAGALDFIIKPFQESRVIETVRKCINNDSGYYGYIDEEYDDEDEDDGDDC